jgi:PAS domain S-box-containing protein
MTSQNDRPGDAAELRLRAEELARAKGASRPENIETLSPEETRRTLHELRVHQIELEMQNEELRRAQVELDAARERYFDLFDLAPVGYCTVSEQGLILEANLTAAGLLGVSRSVLVGERFTRFIVPEHEDAYYHRRKRLFETGAPQRCELRLLRKDASPFWALLEATTAQDADGKPVGHAVISDITELKRKEEALLETGAKLAERTVQLERIAAELEKRNREVERMSRMKTEFLSHMSHELRTPLNAIVGYSDLLSEQPAGPLLPPYPRYVANIQEGAHHLLAVVNDLLDISKIESGGIKLTLERFDTFEILDEVLAVITPLAEIKCIAIENRIARNTAVVADRLRFKQILYNLLSNAVKFTPQEGRVWIKAATEGETFTICVGDTGIGIGPDEQEAIFEEFHQVASTENLAAAGTGLGLTITRTLVQIHGGNIRVESELGKGSRFLVSLPVDGGSSGGLIVDTLCLPRRDPII